MLFRQFVVSFCAVVFLVTLSGCSDHSGHDHGSADHDKTEHMDGDDHSGHDHGSSEHDKTEHMDGDDHANGHAEESDLDPIVVTHFTDKVQLFMEYPHLVRGKEARFLAHVTVLKTGNPVRSGRLELELSQPDGTVISIVANKPARDGLFIPVSAFDVSGTYTGRVKVHSPQVEDDFEFGIVVIHPDTRSASKSASAEAQDESANAIPFLLEQQWPIDFLLEKTQTRTLTKRLLVSGQTVTASGAEAVVSPPVAGRLLPPSSGNLPRIGDWVEANQVLGFIETPLPATEILQLAANEAWLHTMETELLINEFDLSTKGLEVEQAIAQANARLKFAKRTFERITNLKGQGLGTDAQYDDADLAVIIAESELASALERKMSFEYTLTKIQENQSRPKVSSLDNQSGAQLSLPMRAPIAGTIVSVSQIEGEYLEATDHLYRIIDADTIWVIAHVPEFDLADLSESPHALISLPAYPEKSFDILQLGGRLINIGIAVDQASRTLPLVYELPNPQSRFQIGLLVDVHLGTKVARDIVSIPVSAIVPDSGRSTVYVLLDGENFERREVVLGIQDGDYVEIKGGVHEGEWVVARGGNAVRLAALSPASFGHGHAH